MFGDYVVLQQQPAKAGWPSYPQIFRILKFGGQVQEIFLFHPANLVCSVNGEDDLDLFRSSSTDPPEGDHRRDPQAAIFGEVNDTSVSTVTVELSAGSKKVASVEAGRRSVHVDVDVDEATFDQQQVKSNQLSLNDFKTYIIMDIV